MIPSVPIPSDALPLAAHPGPVPLLVVVDEGYFGQEAIVNELGPGFSVAFAEGLGGALAALGQMPLPLVIAPSALFPETGDEVLARLAEHRFDFIGLLMVDDDRALGGPGVHVIIRRPLRPGALARHLRAAASIRRQWLGAIERRDTLSNDLGRLRDGLRHDLRGHLQSIIGLTSLLLEIERPNRAPDAETLELLSRIMGSAERLNRYVDHVGDWLQSARKPLERTIVDLDELVGEVIAEVRAPGARRLVPGLVDAPEISILAHEGERPSPRVPGDARSIGLAVRHLLEHALELAPVGGPHAEVSVEPTTGGWVVRVRDFAAKTLPPSHRARACQLFERAAGGTGVQLAVAAKVAERHGGLVRLEAHPELGHWACLELPGAEAPPHEASGGLGTSSA